MVMDIFFSPSIIAIFLIIIGLYVFSTKYRFGGSKNQKNKLNNDKKVKIKDGKIIHLEQVKEEQPVQDTNTTSKPTIQEVKRPEKQEEVKSRGQPEKQINKEELNGHKTYVKSVNEEPEESRNKIQAAENTEAKPKKVGRLPAIDKFWDYLDVAGRGKRTIQEYKYEWNWWTKEAKEKGKTVYTLKVADIEAILKGKEPSTTRRKIAFLRTLSKWYLREGYPRLHEEAWKLTVPKLPKRIPKDKGPEQFEELREKAKQMVTEKNRVGLWIALKLTCGLRISEIQTARVASKETIQVFGKGKKERLVPAPPWVIVGMKKIKQNGKEGWRQDRFMIWYQLSKMDLKNPHSLRHTCASELLRKGLRIEEIKEFLGHENISTTNIYARAVVPTRASKLLDS